MLIEKSFAHLLIVLLYVMVLDDIKSALRPWMASYFEFLVRLRGPSPSQRWFILFVKVIKAAVRTGLSAKIKDF